jgi:steroid delta-isomerase
MYTDFSFGKMFRHVDTGEAINRPTSSPTEAHMREALEGYVANIGVEDPEYAKTYFSSPRELSDPFGTKPMIIGDSASDALGQIGQLLDVPFTPVKAELTAPVSLSLGNKAAVPFRLWAEVDGRKLTIDIVDVMTFDNEGKICEILAFWGLDNVTFLS